MEHTEIDREAGSSSSCSCSDGSSGAGTSPRAIRLEPKQGTGSVTLITGGMFAGKSTELMRLAKRHEYATAKVQMATHVNDSRYWVDESKPAVVSHDKMFRSAIVAETVAEIDKMLDPDTTVLALDEGQFFPDLADGVEALAARGITVLVAGLNSTFERRPFVQVCLLLAYAENVIKLDAVCSGCKLERGHFSRRLGSETALEIVGGSEKYEASCRACHPYSMPKAKA